MYINKLFILIVILSTSLTLYAQKMYKWVDENGTTNYSKTPPPDDNVVGEEFKLSKTKTGDEQCCSLLRNLISEALSPNSYRSDKEYEKLFKSKNFNIVELTNFVSARYSRRLNRYDVSRLAYSKCINAGFNFCRVDENNKNSFAAQNSWSGTGFIISKTGHILTNEHVVGNCKKIVIQPRNITAELITKDKQHDLALLKVKGSFEDIATFSVKSPLLGEEVVVAGFPYKQLLSSSIKITTGIISSLAGMQNNRALVQITAPIQPGNSGGPLIDRTGSIIGVIVSKLDSEFMLKHFNDIPQNINFAIKGDYVKRFLNKNNIDYQKLQSPEKIEVTEISQKAQRYTVEISCIND